MLLKIIVPTDLTWKSSGAAYGGEPQKVVKCCSIFPSLAANPKSPTTTYIDFFHVKFYKNYNKPFLPYLEFIINHLYLIWSL